MDDMIYKLVKAFINDNCKNRKRFELISLENFIKDKCKGQSGYYECGGYEAFYEAMQRLKKEGKIAEIKSSHSNLAKHPMKLKWTAVSDKLQTSWKDEDIIRLSDMLNFKTYNKHPEYQTKKEWEYVINIYKFLKERGKRQWASVEERCLELFKDEKFLTDNEGGKKENKVLKRLGLKLDDIKAKQYGEQFIYWNRGVKSIKTVIILENHSTFFSFKRAVQQDKDIFGVNPDALIFGYGKKIIKSFSFINEIADPDQIKVYYFGDMDPEGYFIYKALKDRYTDIDITLFVRAYAELIKLCTEKYKTKDQKKHEDCLKEVIKEFNEQNFREYAEYIVKLWNENCRIPQELITYEYLLKSERK